ncbi:MAG: hypothetical protein MK078_03160 [Crocinitomicaceae bacterium]|nr:hypothetical protein [Crocinitomicaceae bacterium]
MRVLLIIIAGGILSFTNRDNREYDNYLSDTEWRISSHAFADENQETYYLSVKEDEEWAWGRFVNFSNSTFNGYYSAPFGNDCFVSTNGTYQFVEENTIFVNVKSITKNGFCSDTGTDSTGFKAYYSIQSNGSGYQLNKIKKP